jgi:hypothetical protein
VRELYLGISRARPGFGPGRKKPDACLQAQAQPGPTYFTIFSARARPEVRARQPNGPTKAIVLEQNWKTTSDSNVVQLENNNNF